MYGCPLETDNIDDLLEQYEKQQREVHINDTSDAICELGYIAEKLESAYENEYRRDPTYKNEIVYSRALHNYEENEK